MANSKIYSVFFFFVMCCPYGRVTWNSTKGLKLTTWWYICTRSTIIKTFIEQTLLRIENIRHTLWVMVACESLAPIIGNYYNKLWLPLKAGPRPRPKAPTTKKKKKNFPFTKNIKCPKFYKKYKFFQMVVHFLLLVILGISQILL